MSKSSIKDILQETKHRPYALPPGRWVYYQEWNRAIFLHWKVPFEALRKLVPAEFNLDTHEGDAYISLVAFTMEQIRPRYLPAVSLVSDFHEINLRTYIDNDERKGVYFLNIEAAKQLSVFMAKTLSGLPYEKSSIQRTDHQYQSSNGKKGFSLHCDYAVKGKLSDKSTLDRWLTERYCLYLDEGESVYRYDIHHKEWELKGLALERLEVCYELGDLTLSAEPDAAHYSDGVQVLAWNRAEVHSM